ncbi:MAG: DNA polymerase III subunit beta [Candidatus Andersenbacteria bacterium]|nr:DNA polymerase III subunit beta [bacterium]MDZ4225643.1 DNA polymerase III subunit beta [Candidatus Andersenbacteria bacterium]
MKFICTKDNLLHGLGRVVPVAGRNKQLPVLSQVLLQLKEGLLNLISTDLEIGVHSTVPGKVEGEGGCAVAARKLFDYVQQLPAINPIVMELKGNLLQVKTKGFQAQFPVTSDDDFPLLPKISESNKIKVSGTSFCDGLTRTMFAAARDETRPEIRSVFIRVNKDKAIMAATDSFRLAEEEIELADGGDFLFLLPLTTAQEVVRLFGGQEELELAPGDNHISFIGEGVELSSRLIEGKYPDYKQIIPSNFKVNGSVDKDEFIRALKTLMVFLPRDTRRVRFVVKPEQEKIVLSVGGEGGEGRVDLSFIGKGNDLDILFNIQYLLEGMQYLPGEQATLRFVGSSEPAVFTPQGDSWKYTYVVMPIQSN